MPLSTRALRNAAAQGDRRRKAGAIFGAIIVVEPNLDDAALRSSTAIA